jgi:Ferredoxin-like domain in Api92-like protein
VPNWTYNRLTVEGEPDDVEAFFQAVLRENHGNNGDRSVLSFERHLPTPAELLEDPDERQPGCFPGWHTWRTQHWGTKWDAMWPDVIERRVGSITYSFATAWGPPDAWLQFVSGEHVKLTFRHEFCEEMRHFAGRAEWHAGSLIAQERLDPDEVEWMEWVEDE